MTDVTRRATLGVLLAAPVALMTTRAHAANHMVTIKGFAFAPASLNVAVGDTVTFTNQDGAPHTATAGNGSFDTGTLKRGKSGQVKITAAGDHDYVCKFHPAMRGVIRAT